MLPSLELPPNLQQYWEDCFYADYEGPGSTPRFGRITRRLAYEDEADKSLPQLPWEQAVVWYDEEDIYDPWLRVEIRVHARFFSRRLLRDAASQACRTVEHLCWTRGFGRHPVAAHVHTAKVARSAKAARVWEVWETTRDIDECLRTLYFERSTQTELEEAVAEYTTKHERKGAKRRFRRKFRNRVKNTLKRGGGPVTRPKTRWWLPPE